MYTLILVIYRNTYNVNSFVYRWYKCWEINILLFLVKTTTPTNLIYVDVLKKKPGAKYSFIIECEKLLLLFKIRAFGASLTTWYTSTWNISFQWYFGQLVIQCETENVTPFMRDNWMPNFTKIQTFYIIEVNFKLYYIWRDTR